MHGFLSLGSPRLSVSGIVAGWGAMMVSCDDKRVFSLPGALGVSSRDDHTSQERQSSVYSASIPVSLPLRLGIKSCAAALAWIHAIMIKT
jgi:hypothetical protein